MSWILKQLTGSLGPYILIAMGVIIVGLSITTKVLWSNNTELHEDLAVANAANNALASANASGQVAIRQLKAANELWASTFQVQQELNAKAIAAAAAFKGQLDAANKQRANAVSRERQEPACEAIMAIDIQRACPVHAQRMRDDAAASPH